MPTGAASHANQVTQEATLTAIQANQTNGTQTTQINLQCLLWPTGDSMAALQSDVQSAPGTPQTVTITVQGNAAGVPIPVSASALPLPTGAATSANQTNGNQETQIVQGGNTAIVTAAGALKVDGSAATQPVSGTVTVTQGTSPWVDNISQFGGSNVVTGTGVSGAGIPPELR